MQNSLFSKYLSEQSERFLPRLLKEGREQFPSYTHGAYSEHQRANFNLLKFCDFDDI